MSDFEIMYRRLSIPVPSQCLLSTSCVAATYSTSSGTCSNLREMPEVTTAVAGQVLYVKTCPGLRDNTGRVLIYLFVSISLSLSLCRSPSLSPSLSLSFSFSLSRSSSLSPSLSLSFSFSLSRSPLSLLLSLSFSLFLSLFLSLSFSLFRSYLVLNRKR